MPTVFRPRFSRVMSAVIAVVAVAGMVMLLVGDGVDSLWRFGCYLALAGYLAVVLFWRPQVSIDDGGVHLVNTFRTIDLPWPAIQRIDTKWALKLFTAYGGYTAWAAPAPSGMNALRLAAPSSLRRLPESTFAAGRSVRPGDLPGTPSGNAALEVRRRWEALRDAGHLDNPRLEHERVPITWQWPLIAVGVALAIWTVLASALG